MELSILEFGLLALLALVWSRDLSKKAACSSKTVIHHLSRLDWHKTTLAGLLGYNSVQNSLVSTLHGGLLAKLLLQVCGAFSPPHLQDIGTFFLCLLYPNLSYRNAEVFSGPFFFFRNCSTGVSHSRLFASRIFALVESLEQSHLRM